MWSGSWILEGQYFGLLILVPSHVPGPRTIQYMEYRGCTDIRIDDHSIRLALVTTQPIQSLCANKYINVLVIQRSNKAVIVWTTKLESRLWMYAVRSIPTSQVGGYTEYGEDRLITLLLPDAMVGSESIGKFQITCITLY